MMPHHDTVKQETGYHPKQEIIKRGRKRIAELEKELSDLKRMRPMSEAPRECRTPILARKSRAWGGRYNYVVVAWRDSPAPAWISDDGEAYPDFDRSGKGAVLLDWLPLPDMEKPATQNPQEKED
jgi:hypothetical protein